MYTIKNKFSKVILTVLFASFAFLANAQSIFTPGGTLGISPNTNIGFRTNNPQFPFHIWDGGANAYTGVGITPGINATGNAKLFALKDQGFLIHTGGQDGGRGQSGIFLGSSLNNQKTTFFSQNFDFNVIDYATTLDGPGYGARTLGIDNLNGAGYFLRMKGGIKAESIFVVTNVWADYVFADDFKLRPLTEVASFIGKNKHLPDVPSEKEIIQNGLNLGEMQKVHMQKIEELTLYIIQIDKEKEEMKARLTAIDKEKEEMKARLTALEKLLNQNKK